MAPSSLRGAQEVLGDRLRAQDRSEAAKMPQRGPQIGSQTGTQEALKYYNNQT